MRSTSSVRVANVRVAILSRDRSLLKTLGAGRRCEVAALTAEIYRSARQATSAISRRMPDAVVVDLEMPGLCGLVWARLLKNAWPKLPVLLLAQRHQPETVLLGLMIGVSGFLSKRIQPSDLNSAIAAIRRGECCLDGQAVTALAKALQRAGMRCLAGAHTPREREVLLLLVQGYSNKEIAAALKISPGTVHSHVARLFKARSVHNRKQASREFVASMIPARLGRCLKCLDGNSLRDLNNPADP